jgi:hypothetical protein
VCGDSQIVHHETYWWRSYDVSFAGDRATRSLCHHARTFRRPVTGVRGFVSYRVKECDMIENYLEAVALIERLHRNYRNLLRESLDRMGSHDINSVQALILFNIGAAKIAVKRSENSRQLFWLKHRLHH